MRCMVLLLGGLLGIACGSSSGGAGPSDGSGSKSGGDGAPLGAPEQGRATYYDATGDGACSFGPSPGDLDVAAMDQAEWNGSAVCGECVAITGPNGKVTVRIVDLCPGCETGHLDLSQEAFAQIADVSAGNVPITWQVEPCAVTGDISYAIKDGSSQYWTGLQVRNSRLPVASLDVRMGGQWVSVPRQSYNYFVDTSGVGPGSYEVRVTAEGGERLTDMLPPVQQSTAVYTVPGSGQF
jgi:expansin (peptidoglycan-binding protein)